MNTIKRVKSKWIILIIMVTSALFYHGLKNDNVSAAEGNDISAKVTITNVDVQIRQGSDWVYIIKDGVEVANHPPIKVDNEIKFIYKWNISDANMAGVQANDYFKIKLPDEYFSFEDMSVEYPLMDNDNPSVQLGTWTLKNNEIITTLNEEGSQKNNITDGFFNAVGLVTKSGNDITIVIPGVALPPITIEPGDDLTEEEHENFGYLNKHGNQLSNKDQIHWGMFVNYENYKNAFEGKTYNKLDNVVLSDDLAPGMIVNESSFEIAVKLHSPTSDGKMSTNVVVWLNIMQQFDKIVPSENETYNDFYDRVKSNTKPAFGIFNGTRVIVSFKNLNGDGNGIKLNHLVDDIQLTALLQSKVAAGEITQQQADGMFTSYSQNSATNGDAIGFMVLFDCDVTGGSGTYENISKLTYDNSEQISNPVEVKFQEITGGATASDPGSIVISKYDAETRDKLEGVIFKLQKKNSLGEYIDYTPRDQIITRTTNNNGQVIFNNLHNGDYKIVEVSSLNGYTSQVTYSPSEFFTIDGNETDSIKVEALNYKQKTLGSIILTKVDKDTREKLKGAKFQLQDVNGIIIKNNLITNPVGEIKVNDLVPGKYKFIEIQAPNGYILNKEKLNFEIVENQTAILKVTFNNEKITQPTTERDNDKMIPKTGNSELAYSLSALLLTGVVIIFSYYRIRKLK